MKNDLLKKWLPHITAIILFLLVSIIFCKPALEGNVLNQHDNIGWKGMAQNSFEYKKEHGHFPIWNPNLFSGMPNYQVALEGKSILPDVTKIFSLGLPKPINFFFLACLCFYVLCLALGIKPIIGMLSALAYSFSTYNPVIIAAGHDTQMLATAYMPLVLAGILLTYQKKYWLGLALTTMGAYLQVSVNHLQVSYYFFLIAGIITIGYLVKWIREKEWKHMAIAGSVIITSAIIGLAGNAMTLLTTSEYSKFTMRGGKDLEIAGDTVMAAKTKGLDTSYAFEYSLGKKEIATLIMPKAFGGSSNNLADESSHVVKKLTDKNIPETNALQVVQNLPVYWGELYTSGPAYLGVIICLLALIGFVIDRSPLRWGLLAATLLGIFMAWGKYFPGFNVFLFEHLPFYNKFRSPAFAQVIPQLTMGIMAALALHRIFFREKSKEALQANFKKILYTAGALFGILALMYLLVDYSASIDKQIIEGYTDKDGSTEFGRLIVAGLKQDRRALFGTQLLRAFALAAVALAVMYFYMKNKLASLSASIILLVVSTLELTMVSHQYLNEEAYIPGDDYQNTNFAPSEVDKEILKDKDPNYRVFNMMGTSSGGPFAESKTTYYHKSVGGYHPAKLRIYQDIIEKYLSGQPNPAVLNMLNTKYIILQNQQTGQPQLFPNPGALGPCWLVKNVKFVTNRVQSITAIGTTDLKDTAIVEASFTGQVVQPQWDSASFIKLKHFDNDTIYYEANCNGPQFAVLSEVYYPKGWNAYIDGKKTGYVNADYILRGISIPSGKHEIKFVFEPVSVKKGRSIMFIASILIVLAFLGGLFMAWRNSRKKTE